VADDQQIQLTVKVNADTGQLEVLGAKFNEVGGKATALGGSFSGLSGEAGNLLKSFLPFATGAGIIAFFTHAVSAAEEENESLRRLQAVVESTGHSWDDNKQKIIDWSLAIEGATRFSKGEALDTLEKLARATGSVTQGEAASTLAMNLSVRTHQSLGEATSTITNLINNNARGVLQATREYGNLTGGATTAQGVLDNLARNVAGAAEKEASLTKETHQVKNAFSEFSKQIGQSIIPSLELFTPAIHVLLNLLSNLGSMVAVTFNQIHHAIQGSLELITALLKGNFSSIGTIAKQTINNLISDVKTGTDQIVATWISAEAKQTAAAAAGHNARIMLSEAALVKQRADAKAEADALVKTQQEAQAKLVQLELQLDAKMEQIGTQTLAKKKKRIDDEVKLEQLKIDKEKALGADGQKAQDALDAYRIAKDKELSAEQLFIKQQLAFDIANTAVQTLQTLNSMDDKGSEAQRIRAKALLAIQQSIAIGWIWVAAAKSAGEVGLLASPLIFALATAQTAMAVAQFAQGSQNIDKAAATQASGIAGININAPVPGITPGANPIPSMGGGGGGFATSGSGGGGSSGGGQAQFVITFNGGLTVNGVQGGADISARLVDQIGQMLIERIKGLGQISFTGIA